MTDDSATLRAMTCHYCEENAGDVWITVSDEWERCPYCLGREMATLLASQASRAKEKEELERQLRESDAIVAWFDSGMLLDEFNNGKAIERALARHASRPVSEKE